MEFLIVCDPKVMLGKPIIKGTRITVEHILEEIAGGCSIGELIDAYSILTREAIQAALKFAAVLSRNSSK